jgi:chemotaxis protein CheD
MSAVVVEKAIKQSVGMGQVGFMEECGELVAILGSCIGVAMYCPRLKLAGLAHVVLPSSDGRDGPPGRYADLAIPHMVTQFRHRGAALSSIAVRIAGGAAMFGRPGPMQIGINNAQAVKAALAKAGLELINEHLGGNKGRRMSINAATGEVFVEIVGQGVTLLH